MYKPLTLNLSIHLFHLQLFDFLSSLFVSFVFVTEIQVSASSKYTLNSSKRTESEATKRSLEWVDSTFELTLTERHFKSQVNGSLLNYR